MMLPAVETGWKEAHEARYAWAFRAYEAFVASLSEEVRQRFVSKDEKHASEAFVVVFGKTQVGKTTLLLELMGVSVDAMQRVSEVLRGGRGVGLSATATTMEYGRSPDDRWGLNIKRKIQWFKNDGDMTQALGSLRQAMQKKQLDVDKPCEVLIPQCCFSVASEQPQVRMLDLPGDKPAKNSVEQAHVTAMAEKYVHQADLILLVGKGEDLGFLKPGELTLPGIEDWQIVPDRFRIVTTYSFTAKSIRDVVRQQTDPLEPELFRTRLIEQIEKFGRLKPSARQSKRFFPLEFGQSWQDTAHKDPSLHQRVSPLIHGFKQQLHADILASTTPLARLKSAMSAHTVVAEVKKSRVVAMQKECEEAAKELEEARKDCGQAKKAVKREDVALTTCRKGLVPWDDAQLIKDLDEHFILTGATKLLDPNKTVTRFRVMVNEARASLRQRVIESRPWHPLSATASGNEENKVCISFWHQLSVDTNDVEVRRLLDDAFYGFVEHLNGYTGVFGIGKDTYISTENHDKDFRRFRRCLEGAEKRLLAAARRWWLEAAQQRLAQMSEELQQHRRRLKRRKSLVERQQGIVDELAKAHESGLLAQAAFEKRMDKELAESRRFKQLLDENYLAELRKRRQAFVQHRSPSRRLIELLGAVHISEARDKLIKVTVDEVS